MFHWQAAAPDENRFDTHKNLQKQQWLEELG